MCNDKKKIWKEQSEIMCENEVKKVKMFKVKLKTKLQLFLCCFLTRLNSLLLDLQEV